MSILRLASCIFAIYDEGIFLTIPTLLFHTGKKHIPSASHKFITWISERPTTTPHSKPACSASMHRVLKIERSRECPSQEGGKQVGSGQEVDRNCMELWKPDGFCNSVAHLVTKQTQSILDSHAQSLPCMKTIASSLCMRIIHLHASQFSKKYLKKGLQSIIDAYNQTKNTINYIQLRHGHLATVCYGVNSQKNQYQKMSMSLSFLKNRSISIRQRPSFLAAPESSGRSKHHGD